MTGDTISGSDWTAAEIGLVVADYFEMLSLELTGTPYVKAHRSAALRELIDRSRPSIEFKRRNISAVLEQLGLPWIFGYKPAHNFQQALLDEIERGLPSYLTKLTSIEQPEAAGFSESSEIFFEQPPALMPAPEAKSAPLRRLLRKFDPAARDERNRALGKLGEERVFHSERRRLAAHDLSLAKKVRWVSQEDGDGAGYDVLSFDLAGNERLLEVKTTVGHQKTPFFISFNELELSRERPNDFRLVRLYDFKKSPRAFKIRPPLDESLLLRPASYRAEFGADA